MFFSLPKLADRNFVLGFLLPVLAAAMAILFLLQDLWPFSRIFEMALDEKKLTDVLVAVIAIWLLACILLACNRELYRMAEGYIGPFNREKWRLRRQQQYDQLRKGFDDKLATVQADDPAGKAYYASLQDFLIDFPASRCDILPTRFGNVIRAFETYSYRVYGIDSIPAWPRLQGVIPKSFQMLLGDARAQVDLFLNLFWLALVILCLSVVGSAWSLGEAFAAHAGPYEFGWRYPIMTLSAMVVAKITYEGAVERARAWGELVKSAFDLYLPNLAKQLGYRLPPCRKRQGDLWDAMNSMFLYWDPIEPADWKEFFLPASTEDAGTQKAGDEQRPDRGNENEGDKDADDGEEDDD